jgi:hypothetical protein
MSWAERAGVAKGMEPLTPLKEILSLRTSFHSLIIIKLPTKKEARVEDRRVDHLDT